MDYERTLANLCAVPAPSGFEQQAAQAAASLLRPLVDEVTIHPLGSVIGVKRCGKPNAPRVMLDAHLDEIGFLITGHEQGFLRFAPLGGVDPRMLPDRELLLLTDPPTPGVVACMPPHIQTREEMGKAQPIRDLWIDVGLSQEQAQRRIPIGTPAVYRTGCTVLQNGVLCGKAMDDRACFAILLDTAEQLAGETLDVDIYIVGSTQEETHSTGAITAAYGIVPDLCVAVDVTHGSSPDTGKTEAFPLGGGPVIGLGPNCTKWMARRMKKTAQDLGLEFQIEVMAGHSGTNGWPLQVSREGVATAVLSVPLRYMHTPVECADTADLKNTATLLARFLRGIGEEVGQYA